MIKLIFLLVLAVLFSWSNSSAQLTRATVGYSSIGIYQLPLWMAKETGLFTKNGLNVDMVYIAGGTTAMMALVGGNTIISQNAGPEVVNGYLSGLDVAFIAGGAVTLDYVLLSRGDIKNSAQLKGGTLGISRFGSVSDFVARFILQKLGLTPNKDVAIIEAGGTTTRLTALAGGRIAATVLNPPMSFIAQKRGFNLLADVASFGLAFQNTAVVSTRRSIRQNPEMIRQYIRAHVEAIHRIKTDPETAKKIGAKYFGVVQDKDALDKTYDYALSDDKVPRKQYPSIEGIKTVLDMLAEKDAKAARVKPEELIDARFVQELDQSGFIDNLYKK